MFLAGLVSGALIVSAVLVLAWLVRSERVARRSIERELAGLKTELANLARVRQNKLYKESLENVGFAAAQAALRVAALRAQLDEETRIILDILDRRESRNP